MQENLCNHCNYRGFLYNICCSHFVIDRLYSLTLPLSSQRLLQSLMLNRSGAIVTPVYSFVIVAQNCQKSNNVPQFNAGSNFDSTGFKVSLYAPYPTRLLDHSKTGQISSSVDCKIAPFLHRASCFLLDTPLSYL